MTMSLIVGTLRTVADTVDDSVEVLSISPPSPRPYQRAGSRPARLAPAVASTTSLLAGILESLTTSG
ncbi:MAG TPA: hypothetical protein VN828_11115, partial [Acidobacteriaceae bacterium]|nr:hypothetical protein [Acidobacteriaceae bacterium]